MKAVKEERVFESHSRVCIADKRRICLFFGEPGVKEISSVKIIGHADDPADWLAVARDVGRRCVALLELDKEQSLSLEGVNLRVMEAAFCKLANITMVLAAGRVVPVSWSDSSRAENALFRIMEKRGALADIVNRVVDAVWPLAA